MVARFLALSLLRRILVAGIEEAEEATDDSEGVYESSTEPTSVGPGSSSVLGVARLSRLDSDGAGVGVLDSDSSGSGVVLDS